MSSSFIANSIACRHLAMMPSLIQPTATEESANTLPVPSMPISWNRSSSLLDPDGLLLADVTLDADALGAIKMPNRNVST
ncbi:MAG: hypothetical protein WB420_25220, partial [Bradyrhizobium sp.]